jgi:CheY-like chemotaxis protein
MPSSPPLASRRILVVDDQESIRNVLRTALVDAGAEVVEAASGAEALEVALRKRTDLILLDIAMPDMNGWQVLEALRGRSETAELPVVLETSSGDFPSFEQARRYGVAAFINKPFRLADVVETCRRILGGARPLLGQEAHEPPALPVQVRDRQDRLLAVGTLVDADSRGAQIDLDAALAQGLEVVLTVLRPEGPERRAAEIRWTSGDGRRFIHGLRYRE